MINCPVCGERTRVVETRDDTRRRECTEGHRFNTQELPETVLRALGQRSITRRVAVLERGVQQRQEQAARRRLIEELLAKGWKPTAVAHRVGVTETRVRQIRSEVAA